MATIKAHTSKSWVFCQEVRDGSWNFTLAGESTSVSNDADDEEEDEDDDGE